MRKPHTNGNRRASLPRKCNISILTRLCRRAQREYCCNTQLLLIFFSFIWTFLLARMTVVTSIVSLHRANVKKLYAFVNMKRDTQTYLIQTSTVDLLDLLKGWDVVSALPSEGVQTFRVACRSLLVLQTQLEEKPYMIKHTAEHKPENHTKSRLGNIWCSFHSPEKSGKWFTGTEIWMRYWHMDCLTHYRSHDQHIKRTFIT